MSWTALLLAGQRPGVDPLAAAFGETWKAHVRVGGEAMLSRVARTLLACPGIARIVVVAQQPDALLTGDCAWLAREPRVTTALSHSSIAMSVADVAGSDAAPWPVLVTTADHPLLTVDMVEAVIADAKRADISVAMVARRTLLAAYPGNKRTWLNFAHDGFTGANLFALTGPAARKALAAWSEVERDRKKAIKLIWHFGPWLAIRALTRTITLATAMRTAGRRLGFTVIPIVLPWAEAGIDVDKPSDHALAETILHARASSLTLRFRRGLSRDASNSDALQAAGRDGRSLEADRLQQRASRRNYIAGENGKAGDDRAGYQRTSAKVVTGIAEH